MTSVKKNYIYSSLYQLMLIIIPLVTSPYISRRLGPEMLGTQSYCYSIATYFYLFAMLGVTNYGNRSVAAIRDDRNELSKTFWTIYFFQLLRGVVVLTIYIAYILLFQKEYFVIALLNGLYVLSGLIEINWFFFGLELFKVTVTRNIIIKLTNVAFIFIFIKGKEDLWLYSLMVAGTAVVSNLYLWFYVKKYVDFYKPKLSEFIPHIKPEVALFIPVIAISLYKVMDRIMLGSMTSTTQVGFYTNSESIINIPMSLITALGTVMMPHAANLIARGKTEESKKEIETSMVFVVCMSTIMMFGLSAIAPVFAPVFFGSEFADCSAIIVGLSPTIVFISWANVIRTQYLIPRKRDKEYICSILAGAGVNLLINFLLIPRLQAIGAVIGTVSAEFTVCFLQSFFVRKELPIPRYIKQGLPFLFISGGMFIVVRLVMGRLGENIGTVVLGIVIGGLSYFVMVLPYILNSKQEAVVSLKKSFLRIIHR